MIHNSPTGIVTFTGAAGNVGRRVVPLLKDRHALRLTDLRGGTLEGLPVQVLDLRNFDDVLKALKGSSTVVHLAIADYTGVEEDIPSPLQAAYQDRMLEVNVRGTYHVFEAARVLRIPKIVFISSLTVALGRGLPPCRVEEKPCPVNFYACTKLFGENLAEVYQRLYGIKCHILRLGQPYPMGLAKEKIWKQDPTTASLLVTFAEIAQAIDVSLKAEISTFCVYNILSNFSGASADFFRDTETKI